MRVFSATELLSGPEITGASLTSVTVTVHFRIAVVTGGPSAVATTVTW